MRTKRQKLRDRKARAKEKKAEEDIVQHPPSPPPILTLLDFKSGLDQLWQRLRLNDYHVDDIGVYRSLLSELELLYLSARGTFEIPDDDIVSFELLDHQVDSFNLLNKTLYEEIYRTRSIHSL